MMKRALSVVVLCLLPALAFAAPSLVILNAKVFTGDANGSFAEGLAIEGNKIVAVGTSNQMKALAGPKTRIVNADGKLVIPGINDAHTHPGLATTRIGFAENIDATTEQLLAALQSVVEEAPADFWLVGTSGPAVILDATLTRQKLDEVAPGRKVMVTAFTGHGTAVSTAGLAALGVGLDAPDPLGGWFGRDASGKLNGRASEYAEYDLQRRFGELATEDELLDSIRAFSDDAIRFGITSAQAMPYVNEERFGTAIRNSGVPLRIRNIAFPAVADPSFKPQGTAVKWILDGTPIERGGALRTSQYPDHTQGRLNFTDIDAFLKTARDRRAQILLHASGDKTVAQALNRLAKSTFERPRIEHGDGLQQDLYDVAKKAKAIVVLNPTHFPFRGAYPAGQQYMPGQGLVKNGIPIAIGSDGPLNPYLNMFFAITREDTPAQKMSRVDVLRAYTSGSAFAEFTETTKGRIAPGMLADVAMLSQDILTVEPALLADTHSVLTIIDGKVVAEE
jgi:predicted amidohydrolase YtcJ